MTRWFKWERESGILPIMLCCEASYSSMKNLYGECWPKTYLIFENNMVSWMNDFDELDKKGIIYVRKLMDEEFKKKLMGDWKKASDELGMICLQVRAAKLSKLTSKELYGLYKKFHDIHFHWWTIAIIAELVAYGGEFLLKEIICKKFSADDFNKKQRDIFNDLTVPTNKSFLYEEEGDLMEILRQMYMDKGDAVAMMLKKHAEKYYWLQNNYLDTQILDAGYFKKILDGLVKVGVQPEKVVKSAIKKLNLAKKIKIDSIKKLNLDKDEEKIVWILDDFIYFQDIRKKHNLICLAVLDSLLGELGRRNKISVKDLKFLLPGEIFGVLNGRLYREEIGERKKYCSVVYSIDNHEILTGNKAREFVEKIFGAEKDYTDVKEISGMTASPGNVVGKVRVLKSPKDIDKMEEGDILVSTMTSPDFVAAMKKASAIVTDQGGVTCHAAIVSRELGIPCVIGTKIATKVLKDGDIVEVKGNHGIVKVLEK